MSSKEEVCCAICGRAIPFGQNDYKLLAEQMNKALEEVSAINIVVCGPCTQTEKYRSNYFAKIPHLALNK